MGHMKQARRIDNGDLVQGYLVHIDLIRPINSGCSLRTINMSGKGDFRCNVVRIDPATVEDVAVKPIFNSGTFHFCPKCVTINHTVSYDYLVDPINAYCRRCGQRIDWSGEDGNKQREDNSY